MTEKKISREKEIPAGKVELVEKLAEKIKNSKTILIVSTKGLPASQFQKIKKSLRGKVEIVVAKKNLIERAIGKVEKGVLQNLKKYLNADVALMFSEIDAFELAGLLVESQSPAKAKIGEIALEDIKVEEGLTDLIPGPAISELGAVGLKVVVEGGKLAIKRGAVIVKKGEAINEKVAGVMTKLGIQPMKVGFIPLVGYDAGDDKIYTEIKIDKEQTLMELKEAIGKAFGFSVEISYVNSENVKWFIAKASLEEKILSEKVSGVEKQKEAGKGKSSDGEVEESTNTEEKEDEK